MTCLHACAYYAPVGVHAPGCPKTAAELTTGEGVGSGGTGDGVPLQVSPSPTPIFEPDLTPSQWLTLAVGVVVVVALLAVVAASMAGRLV